MTDALPPEQRGQAEATQPDAAGPPGPTGRPRQGKRKKAGGASAKGPDAEQVREARESAQARNAEAPTRDRMVDIGRGTQQAGRQRAK